jgi:hypothetical protein
VFPAPLHERVEALDLLPRVEARVGADADRDRARGELNQPEPVALVDQVRRREPPQAALRHAVEPFLVVGAPVLEVEAAGEADPGRVDVVTGLVD